MKGFSSPSMVKLARRYLKHRRAFGYRLRAEGYDLLAFARFLDHTAPGQPLNTKLALQWVTQKAVQPVTIANRLSAIRGFARFCATLDPRTQIPPTHLTSSRSRRRAPHIFSDAQLQLILRRTKDLRPWRNPLRPLVYRTLIGLLVCTGLRPAEAIRLRDEDFDAATGTLRVPAVKRSPPRLLPLHPSTVRALQRYQSLRRLHYPLASHFFVGPFGRPLQMCAADWTFRRLVHGMVGNGSRPNPRLYDLRHRFATQWIARWSRQSAPLDHRLVLLSRYLGHRYFHDTYWYVQPESSALKKAATRFEQYRHQTHPG
jgi:integrase